MKFIRKKVLKERPYYYFELPIKTPTGRVVFTRYIGHMLPDDLAEVIQNNFKAVGALMEETVDVSGKAFFKPKSIHPIEDSRAWYVSLHHELFQNDLKLFRSLFAILFILNSNRAEGSKVTRKDIEKLITRKQKPKTIIDLEVINSLSALHFAFSRKMRWNPASLKRLHYLLFNRISPEIAGTFKRENNVINNEPTTDWKNVRKELKMLLDWFSKNKKKKYPPVLALEFHHRFEAIHPFIDGNGRIGRLLFNAYLLQQGYMPVIFFSENHRAYSEGLSQARQGRKRKLAHYLLRQVQKTRRAVTQYKKEGIIRGGSPQIGQWEIEQGKIRKY